MKQRIDSAKLRILVAASLVLAAVSLAAVYLELRDLNKDAELAQRARSLAYVRMVALFVERRFPGEWREDGGFLFKGGSRLEDGTAIRGALSDFLPPDATIIFGIGDPPAALPSQAPRGPDSPFLADVGVVMPLRSAAGKTVGWLSIASAEAPRLLAVGRARSAAILGLAGLSLAAILALGAAVLRLTNPGERMAELEQRSRRDGSTGLLNRRGIAQAVDDPLSNHGLSHVAILDIDRFAALKEERGAEEGGRALAALARAVVSIVRAADVCGRWEADELIVVYRGLAPEHAAVSAERLRAGVEGRAFGTAAEPLRLTITVGIAPIGAAGFAAAAAAADAAMREGKRSGRNRVVAADQVLRT